MGGIVDAVFGGSSAGPVDMPGRLDPSREIGHFLYGQKAGQEMKGRGFADEGLQQGIIDLESQYRPKYAELGLQDLATALQGTEGAPGLISLLREAEAGQFQTQQELINQQRAGDVFAMGEFGPQAVEAYRQADPYSTEMAELQSEQARGLYSDSQRLSPERRRQAEQQAREASLARGRIGDTSSIAAEILGREDALSRLRSEARESGQLAYGMNRGLAGDSGMGIFYRPSETFGSGAGLLGFGQGMTNQTGPRLFDPNAPLNMAMQRSSNITAAQGANAESSGGLLGGSDRDWETSTRTESF